MRFKRKTKPRARHKPATRAFSLREQLCGVCACWTIDGDNFLSGGRQWNTGQTPWDNFICKICQREAHDRASAVLLKGALEQEEERSTVARMALTMREKIAPWQEMGAR